MLVANHNIYENIRTRAIIPHQGQVLLLSPTQPDGWWCPPGGGLEPNESLTEAIIREVYEETGLEVEVAGVAFLREWIFPKYCPYPEPQASTEQAGFGLEVFFYTTPTQSQPLPRPETATSKVPIWIPLTEVPDLEPLWPKELKALAIRLTAGEKIGGIASFISDNLDITATKLEKVSFEFEIDKNGLKVSG